MIVADTHALLWWMGPRDRLSAKARDILDRSDVGISAITCFEVARLVERGRFGLGQDVRTWLEDLFKLPQLAFLPLTMDVSIAAAKLSDPVRDPIDRIIVATALHHGAPLVTKDRKIIDSGVVPTLW